jgi:hypothetical protein
MGLNLARLFGQFDRPLVTATPEEVIMSREPVDESKATAPPMPRWVKVFGLVMGIVLLLVVAMMLLSGGKHGPERHLHQVGSHQVSERAKLGAA